MVICMMRISTSLAIGFWISNIVFQNRFTVTICYLILVTAYSLLILSFETFSAHYKELKVQQPIRDNFLASEIHGWA